MNKSTNATRFQKIGGLLVSPYSLVAYFFVGMILVCSLFWLVFLEPDQSVLDILKEDWTLFFRIPFRVCFHSSISVQSSYGGADFYY